MALATRRRSLHFVPGGNEKMIAKALTLPADGLILDLEDAVAPDLKEATRPIVTRWLSNLDFGGRERWVRMNPIYSEYGERDLEETIAGMSRRDSISDALGIGRVSSQKGGSTTSAVLAAIRREPLPE